MFDLSVSILPILYLVDESRIAVSDKNFTKREASNARWHLQELDLKNIPH